MISQIPFLWVVGGLAALAGVFYLLQRLRVRQRPVTVETTLFWKDAVEDARARVFVQRFRHPWVYALLLLIGSLLWLGFSGVETSGDNEGRHLVLLDASAVMTEGDRFAETVGLVEDYVSGLSPSNRWVVLCGARPQTVLRPGEDTQLLSKRLEGLAPEACPPTISDVLGDVALSGRSNSTICIAGAADVAKPLLDSLPKGVRVVRLASTDSEAGKNASITSLGFSPADSGRWDHVDVLVEVASTGGTTPTPAIAINGKPSSVRSKVVKGERSTRFYFKGLAARGEVLTASISDGGALKLDDEATLLIPDRRPLAIIVAPGVPAPLVRALESDPGISIVTSDASVVVRPQGSDVGEGLPALEVASEELQEDGILAIHQESEDPTQVLMALHSKLGLSEIDASDLAREGNAPVTMGAAPGPRRTLKVWDSLFTDEFNFTRSRAFPLFVGTGIRWLASFVPSPETAAVGSDLPLDGGTVSDEEGRVFNTLGDSFRPARSGKFTTAAGVDFVASYLAGESMLGSEDVADLAQATSSSTGGSLVSILLMVAMIAILGEWILYRLGRIP